MKDFLRIMLLAIIVCCWNCSGGDEDTPTPTPKPEETKIEVTTVAPVVEQTGGTSSVTFTSTNNWTIDVTEGRAVSWCTVSPTNGGKGTNTLTITTTDNDTYDERNAKVTIKSGASSKSFTITQKQKDALTVTSNKVEIGAEGGNFTIEAKANVNIAYEIEESAKDWISVGESRGLTTKTLNFTAKVNENTERREGKVILKGGDGLTETVTVYQEGEKPTLVISSDDVIVNSEGDTVKIELKSNVDYTITLPEVNWITIDESRAISTYTHYLLVAPNETYDQRNAHVFFHNETEGLKDSINITQMQKDAIIVAKNEYVVEAEAGKLGFPVNTNVDFEVSVSVNWIQQIAESRGLVEKPLSFMIAENDSTESREGEIIIAYQDLQQIVRIKQKGAIDYEAIERTALTEFYKATGGDKWLNNANWCSDAPLKDWYGIETYPNGRVRSFKLSNNNISGYLPEAIGDLQQMEFIYLSGNPISGTIPKSIGNLKLLRDLFIESTSFEGELPKEFFELENLQEFWARNNKFQGKIPAEFSKLKKLRSLGLSNNKLEGPIPPEIGELSNLYYLELDNNPLACVIPKEIGNLKELGMLNLNNCGLYGSIPTEIGGLSNLRTLDFNFNPLFSSIPSEIGNLKELVELRMNACGLYGSIPSEVGELTNLQQIYMSSNQLSGEIPSTLGNLGELKWIDLHSNKLYGNIPETLGNLKNLEYISLCNNDLYGDVPQSILQLDCWQYMWWNILAYTGIEVPIDGGRIPGPTFEVKDLNGNVINSSIEYANNKFTVLVQWDFPDECKYSADFIKSLIPLYEKYRDKGVEIIGWCPSSWSTEERIKDYVRALELPWRNFKSTVLNGFGGNDDFPSVMFNEANKRLTVNVVDSNGNIVFSSSVDEHYDLPYFLAMQLGEENPFYTSTDYSRDGEVIVLQEATQGKGIDLIFMGEAFVDKDMGEGGLYEQTMKDAMEQFFIMEPYKSFRNRFNIYTIKVVSPNAEYSKGARRRINESLAFCFGFVREVLGLDEKDIPKISVIYNKGYDGRSYTLMGSDGSFVAYMMTGVNEVLNHETGGHGFAKLLDEYVEWGNENLPLPEEEKIELDRKWKELSTGANVDWRNDKETVKWAHFLSDSRYANEGLGLYEGSYLYGFGAYRPSENSMMRHNDSPFNAPSREAIYKRIMSLSEGEDWEYNYEVFVEYDKINRDASSRSTVQPLTEKERKEYVKKHRKPKFIKGTWLDAIKKKTNDIVVPLR